MRTKVSILNRRLAQFGALQLHHDIEPERVERYEHTKAELQQQISSLQVEIEQPNSSARTPLTTSMPPSFPKSNDSSASRATPKTSSTPSK